MDRNANIGNGANLTREIKDLLDHDRINQQAATRLLLLAVASMLEDLQETRADVGENKEALATLERYPSLYWMIMNRPKQTVAIGVLTWFSLYFLASAISVFDIAKALLIAAGLPLP